MNPEDLLLRDIHLPDPVSWWPPAIGWWLLVGAVLVAAVTMASWWRRRQVRRNAPASIARLELVRLRAEWLEHGDARCLVNDLSNWLRRAGMSITSRKQAASLTGSDWLDFLDELAGEPVFSDSNGRLVAEAPYQDLANPDGEEMFTLCERWLGAVSDGRRGARG
jgi:aryl carrier-like protein